METALTDATPHIVVTLDGTEHPIFLDEVTSRQVMLVREAFGMSPRIFPRLIEAEQAGQRDGLEPNSFVDTPEVAAMVYLSRLQVEGPDVDVLRVQDSVKVGSEVHIRLPRQAVEAEVPDLDPPA